MKLHPQLRLSIVNQLKQINDIPELVDYRNEIWDLLANRQVELENKKQ